MKNFQKESFLIVSKCTYFFSNPSNISILEYLIEKKHYIHLIIPEQIYQKKFKSRINLSYYCFNKSMPENSSLKENIFEIFKIIYTLKCRSKIKKIIEEFKINLKLKLYTKFLLYKIKLGTTNKPIKVLFIDDKSMYLFHEIKKCFPHAKKYYISYEIWFKNETPVNDLPYFYSLKKHIKEFENIIIQDEARESIFRNEKNILNDKITFKYLPVAYENIRYPTKKKSSKKILISGSLDLYTGVDQIIKLNETESTLENFEITFQTHRIETTNPNILKIIKGSSKSNILLDDRNFSDYKTYFNYISLYDIGISIYIPHLHSDCSFELGKNIEEIGLSSGKMNAYLANSLPVVATKSGYLDELNNKYKFGILIETISELPKALEEICFNYSEFSQNVFKFYKKVLKPSNYLNGIFKN